MNLKIVIFGTSISSAYLSGATLLFRGLAKAFLRRGFSVIFIEEFHPWLESDSDFNAEQQGIELLRYTDRSSLVSLLQNLKATIAEENGLVLKFSGSSILHDQYIDEWLAMRRHTHEIAFTVVYVDADAPMRMPFITAHPRFYLHAIISHFDGVWVILGGDRAANEYTEIGANRVWYRCAAVDIHAFEPREALVKYRADLLFIGNPAVGRANSVRRLLMSVAEECPNMNFLLAGAEWGNTSLPENVRYIGYVPSDELPVLYSSVRFVLNITREEMSVYGEAAAMRLFEASACGACIMSDYWSGLEKLFRKNEEILIIESSEDVRFCLNTVDWYKARRIGQQARNRTLKENSADIRVSEFLAVFAPQCDRPPSSSIL